jgi:hypothetical protein
VIPGELIDAVKHETENKGFNKGFEIRTMRDETRIQDFWQYSEPVRQLALNRCWIIALNKKGSCSH